MNRLKSKLKLESDDIHREAKADKILDNIREEVNRDVACQRRSRISFNHDTHIAKSLGTLHSTGAEISCKTSNRRGTTFGAGEDCKKDEALETQVQR